MALVVENANAVRQRVYNALQNVSGTTAGSGDPSAWYTFKTWFLSMAANKNNPDLQFVPFDATTAVAGDGYDTGVDAACRLYAVYVKKTSTTTDSWFRVIDDADNDSEEIGDSIIEVALKEGNDVFYGIYPNGQPIAAGVAITFTTTAGDTQTQSSAADAGNGFIIIGRP